MVIKTTSHLSSVEIFQNTSNLLKKNKKIVSIYTFLVQKLKVKSGEYEIFEITITGTQKLALEEFSRDYHYDYSNNLYISKQQGINIPQWKTQIIDFFDLKCYNFYLDITIRNSHVPAVLPLLSP